MKNLEVLELTKKLVSIRSLSGEEKEIMRYALSYFDGYGIPAYLDEYSDSEGNRRYNLEVGNISHTKLLFSAHLDTVGFDVNNWKGDPLEPKVKDGKLYGRGSVDTKSNAAAAMVALKNSYQMYGNPKAALLLESDEEDEFRGAKRFLSKYENKGLDLDLVIICEPTDLKIVKEQKGLYHSRALIRGNARETHASAAQRVENGKVNQPAKHAIEEAIPILQELKSFKQEIMDLEPDEKMGPVTFTITEIQGGIGKNSIPLNCRITTDSRVPQKYSSRELANKLEERIRPLMSKDDEFEISSIFEPVEISESHPVVQKFIGSVGGRVGVKKSFTELPLYTEKLNVPGVIYGTSPSDRAHAPDEFVNVGSIKAVKDSYEKAISQFCNKK